MALILCVSHQALWYLQIYSKDALGLTSRIYGNVKDGKMLEDRFMESYEDFDPMNGWMICDFTSFSTVFQSYQDAGRMKVRGCVQ